MTVIGALSSFRERGEMSPHNLHSVQERSSSRLVGDPELMARFWSPEIKSDWPSFVCGQALPRNWMIFRRSRFDGLPAGNSSNCFIALRSAATFWRSSRLASASR
jgi:hypothetical protein